MAKDTTKENDSNPPQPNFNGAAVIDEHGNEIPITEEMIKSACDELEDGKSKS